MPTHTSRSNDCSKYIDSHLKPFRCKSAMCSELQFSSTACLLRHEREAHGMHGHGSKPHLCFYNGCERSIPGNGFPRRYNLNDHMKRVHDYTGPTSSPSSGSTAVQTEPVSAKQQNGQKRKASEASSGQSEKRRKGMKGHAGFVNMLSAEQRRAKELQQLHTQWAERRASLQSRLQTVQGPLDITGVQQISEDVAALQRLSEQLNDLG